MRHVTRCCATPNHLLRHGCATPRRPLFSFFFLRRKWRDCVAQLRGAAALALSPTPCPIGLCSGRFRSVPGGYSESPGALRLRRLAQPGACTGPARAIRDTACLRQQGQGQPRRPPPCRLPDLPGQSAGPLAEPPKRPRGEARPCTGHCCRGQTPSHVTVAVVTGREAGRSLALYGVWRVWRCEAVLCQWSNGRWC